MSELYVSVDTLSCTNTINNESYCVGTPLNAYKLFMTTCRYLSLAKDRIKAWKVSICRGDNVLFESSDEEDNFYNDEFMNKLTKWAHRR